MIRFLLSVLMLSSSLASAREINLMQALQMAEQHSFSLQKAQALRDGASAELRAARTERFPTLSATGTAFYVSEIPKLTIAAGPVSVTRDMGTDQTYQADFRLVMPLFTGGRITGAIDIASASADYYAALASADLDRLAFQTRAEYFGLWRSDGQSRAAHAALQRAQAIEKSILGMYEAGAADSVNLLEVSLAVTRAKNLISQAETGRRSSEIRLAYLLGLSPAESFTLMDSLSETQLPVPPDQSPPARAELAAADAGVRLSQAKLTVTRADYFPALSAFGGYSYGKPNLDRFNNTWNDYFTVGANLTWSFNLGNRTARKTRAARFVLDAAAQDRRQVQETLTRDAALYYEQLKYAQSRYQSAVIEAGIATANYSLADAQFRDGVMAANRLLEIAADLNSAEASLASSLADYHLALGAYYYAIGSANLRRGL